MQVKSECDYDDEDIGVADGLGSLAGFIEVICVYVYTHVCVRVSAFVDTYMHVFAYSRINMLFTWILAWLKV